MRQVDQLRAENERLRLALADLETAQQTALLNAEAQFKTELKDVKSKAASRIKDLMNRVGQPPRELCDVCLQVAEQELREQRLKRDARDAQLRLRSADQALLDKDQETDRLEGALGCHTGMMHIQLVCLQWKLLESESN